MKRAIALAWVLCLVAACQKSPDEAAATAARHEPVVVYASYGDEQYLPALFESFTASTGIPVTVRHRREEQIVAEVIENSASPPADVLLTRSLHGMWLAADEGALRPLQPGPAAQVVAEWLRDPDGYWVATGFTPVGIVIDPGQAEADGVSGYEDLGRAEFESKLCLSAPFDAVNRSLVANLIATHGTREAEMIVRSWTANMALPAFDSERDLLEAISAGRCAIGIVSEFAVATHISTTLRFVRPEPAHVVTEAAGIGRHARYPANAQVLVDWLVGEEAQREHAKIFGFYPSNTAVSGATSQPVLTFDRNAGVAGAFDIDAINLAERAGWR
jgi:iron(III) transport system substrate-binding protein